MRVDRCGGVHRLPSWHPESLSSTRGRREERDETALIKEMYAGHEKAVLMLGDVLEKGKCETENIVGEAMILPVLKKAVGKAVSLNQDDHGAGNLVD